MDEQQPEQNRATWGQVEDQHLTWGDVQGEPEGTPLVEQGEVHRVSAGGACICDKLPEDDTNGCPTHGDGPRTIEEATWVAEAYGAMGGAPQHAVQLGASGDTGGDHTIPLAPFGTAQTHDAATTPGMDPQAAQGAPSIADFPLNEAPEEEFQGKVQNLRTHLEGLVLTAAEKTSGGETANVGVTFMPVPDPEDPTGQSLAMGALVCLDAPGMILGTRLINTKIIPFIHGWTEQFAEMQMREMWETARQQRSQQPEAMRQQQEQARQAANAQGNGYGGNGLIIPGMNGR